MYAIILEARIAMIKACLALRDYLPNQTKNFLSNKGVAQTATLSIGNKLIANYS